MTDKKSFLDHLVERGKTTPIRGVCEFDVFNASPTEIIDEEDFEEELIRVEMTRNPILAGRASLEIFKNCDLSYTIDQTALNLITEFNEEESALLIIRERIRDRAIGFIMISGHEAEETKEILLKIDMIYLSDMYRGKLFGSAAGVSLGDYILTALQNMTKEMSQNDTVEISIYAKAVSRGGSKVLEAISNILEQWSFNHNKYRNLRNRPLIALDIDFEGMQAFERDMRT